MRTLIFIFILISVNLFGQTAIFKWNDETCEYESLYDKSKYSEAQLKNCYQLTYNFTFRINHTPNVFKPNDIKKLNIDTLDAEYNAKMNQLEGLVLPNSKYWDGLRKSIMIELEQLYRLSRITYQGFSDPKLLKEWFYQDSCLNKHANSLINGGDSLLKDWYVLTSMLVKKNCCPDKVWGKYYNEFNSVDRLIYAQVEVTTFGWWNCAINHIEHSRDRYDDEMKQKEFYKLFIKTKTINCDEP